MRKLSRIDFAIATYRANRSRSRARVHGLYVFAAITAFDLAATACGFAYVIFFH
jgi:hypothetical protein